jgi:hypothetical protein
MDPERSTDPRDVQRAFWKGFGRGLGQSLSSRESAVRFRISYIASLIGSIAAQSWARHLKAVSHEPFTISDQIAVLVTGAVAGTTLALLCRWLWRRWTDAPTA